MGVLRCFPVPVNNAQQALSATFGVNTLLGLRIGLQSVTIAVSVLFDPCGRFSKCTIELCRRLEIIDNTVVVYLNLYMDQTVAVGLSK